MINWFLLKHFVCAIFVLVKFLTLPASPCVMDACKMLFFLLLVTCPNVYSLSRFCLASWLGITVLNTKSISLGSFNQDSIPWKLYGTSFNKADSAVYYLADRMRLLLFWINLIIVKTLTHAVFLSTILLYICYDMKGIICERSWAHALVKRSFSLLFLKPCFPERLLHSFRPHVHSP